MNKILLLFVIVACVVCSFFYELNSTNAQLKDIAKNNKKIVSKNVQDLFYYRSNPVEYFRILRDKQINNTNNFYAKFELTGMPIEFYKKNDINKIITPLNPETYLQDYKFTIEYRKNGFVYSLIPVSTTKYIAIKTKESNPINLGFGGVLYSLPKENTINKNAVRYVRQTTHAGRVCSIWIYGQSKESIDNPHKHVTYESCYDEQLGIAMYSKFSNPDLKIYNKYSFFVSKIEIDTVKDEDLIIPKQIKFFKKAPF